MAQLAIAMFIYVGLFLQTSIFGFMPVMSVQPDLLLALVVFLALYSAEGTWPLRYWVVGLAKDVASSGPLGVHALTFMIAGVLVHYVRKDIYRELWSTRIWLVFFGCLAANGMPALFQNLSFGNFHLLDLATRVFIEASYSALISPVILVPLVWARFFLQIPAREMRRAI